MLFQICQLLPLTLATVDCIILEILATWTVPFSVYFTAPAYHQFFLRLSCLGTLCYTLLYLVGFKKAVVNANQQNGLVSKLFMQHLEFIKLIGDGFILSCDGLLQEFNNLHEKYWSGRWSVIVPRKFKDKVCEVYTQFSGNSQVSSFFKKESFE